MFKDEFDTFKAEVEDAFDVKYNAVQTRYWYDSFKNVALDVGLKIVELYYNNATTNKKPKPNDLLMYRNQAFVSLGKVKEKGNCKYCKGSGLVILKKKHEKTDDIYDYCIRCFCETGDMLDKKTKQLNRYDMKNEYVFLSESGQHLVIAEHSAFAIMNRHEEEPTVKVVSKNLNKIMESIKEF